jgi:hypothetical protein
LHGRLSERGLAAFRAAHGPEARKQTRHPGPSNAGMRT